MKSYTDLHYPTVIAASASMPGFVNTSTMCQAYSLQYIADAPKFSGYLPAVQKMIDSLVINKSLGTDMPDNSTNLHPDNLEKCHNGLCYVMWTKTAGENLK